MQTSCCVCETLTQLSFSGCNPAPTAPNRIAMKKTMRRMLNTRPGGGGVAKPIAVGG